jgi:hypothetical protein
MYTADTTTKVAASRPRRTRRLTAVVCALALTAIASGSVAAAPLDRDNRPDGPLWIGLSPMLVAKLGTTAGYNVLAFG